MLTAHERLTLYLRLSLRLIIFTLAVCAVVFLFRPVMRLFGPFVFALLIAWLLNPLIRVLNRKLATSRRFLAFMVVLLLFTITATVIVLILYRVFSELFDLAKNWQSLWASIQPAFALFGKYYNRLISYLPAEIATIFISVGDTVANWLQTKLAQISEPIVAIAGNFATGIASGFIAFVVFIVAAYFITADYPRMRWKMRQSIGDDSRFAGTLKQAAGSALSGYLKAQLLLSGAVGLIVLVALLIWRQDYSLIIALLTAMIDFIPFFGSGIILIPWGVFNLVTGTATKGLFLLALSFVCFLFRKLAEPKIVGDHTGLSPLMSLISIYVGMKLAGVGGMILSPVVFMMFITMYRVGAFGDTIHDIKAVAQDLRQLMTSTAGSSGDKPEQDKSKTGDG